LRGLFCTNASVAISGFVRECTVDLPVPCIQDFEVAAPRFFDGVEQGDAPLSFLFSGPIFFHNEDGDLQIAHYKEAGFRLPLAVRRTLIATHYADMVLLRIGRDLFEAIGRYKRRERLPGIGEALRALLAHDAEATR
jgi:hypothetical protein